MNTFDSAHNDAEMAARALGGDVTVDAEKAYARFHSRALSKKRMPRWYLPAAVATAAAVLACALFFTPLGGYANAFLTIFEPREFQPINLSAADLRGLKLFPNANEIGTQRIVAKPKRTDVASFAAAQAHVGFALLRPTVLPAQFGAAHSYVVYSPGQVTFTFSAAKAQASARRSHKTLPPMPPGLDGATIRLQLGDNFDARYQAGKTGRSFALIEMRAPRVTSSGASLQTLERYVLAMPNVSPALASQIQALAENSVPVPVNIDKQHAQHVDINGTPGLAIGDNTGLGAGVMWQKDGIVYVVAGPLSMNDVLTVANGLR